MPLDLRSRLAVIRRILDRPVVKILGALWVVLCTYDTLLSQVIPESWGQRFPKAREIVFMTSGWLPFWGWLLILAAGIVLASFEYAHRRAPHPVAEPTVTSAPLSRRNWLPEISGALILLLLTTEVLLAYLSGSHPKITDVASGANDHPHAASIQSEKSPQTTDPLPPQHEEQSAIASARIGFLGSPSSFTVIYEDNMKIISVTPITSILHSTFVVMPGSFEVNAPSPKLTGRLIWTCLRR